MERILVPTDFTETAENGLKLAVDIAGETDAEIILLNVVYPVHGTTFTAMGDINTLPRGKADRFMVELVRKNRARLKKEIEKHEKKGVKIIPQIDFEDKVHGLNHYVKEHNLDLIVIGTKGSKSLSEYLFGTHTENIIKASDCPVISVKGSVEGFYPESIVLALDISNDNNDGIREVKNFADQFNGEVHFLYVLDDGIDTNKATSKLDIIARSNKFSKYTINTVKDKGTEDAIVHFSKRKSADMLAVVSEGKKGIKELLFGSVANDIINNVEIPVFVVPD